MTGACCDIYTDARLSEQITVCSEPLISHVGGVDGGFR